MIIKKKVNHQQITSNGAVTLSCLKYSDSKIDKSFFRFLELIFKIWYGKKGFNDYMMY